MSAGRGDDTGGSRKKTSDFNLSGQIWIPKPKKPPDPDISSLPINSASEGEGKGVSQSFFGEDEAGKSVESLLQKGKEEDSVKISNAEGIKKDLSNSKSNKPGSWAALFKKACFMSDDLCSKDAEAKIRAIQENSTDEILIDEELMQVSRSQWINYLYGKFFGKTPPLSLIQNVMLKIWKIKYGLNVIDLALGYFCFKFTSNDDLNHVLTNGPWFLNGQVLLTTHWKVNFQPCLEKIETIPVWIQFPGLPVEYLYKDILLQLAAKIGQPIKVDEITMKGSRAKYARDMNMTNLENDKPTANDSVSRLSESDNLYGPWQMNSDGKCNESVQEKGKQVSKPDFYTRNSLRNISESIMECSEPASHCINPFSGVTPSKSKPSLMKSNLFSTSRNGPVKVPIKLDKCVEEFHKKMTKVMEITVSEIIRRRLLAVVLFLLPMIPWLTHSHIIKEEEDLHLNVFIPLAFLSILRTQKERREGSPMTSK
ncbi:hypothetical protein Cni_G27764 [Canna indica]|uniref:DUF4283 domain-containing protein n=1 Tax=Canna indica TaxID=4628 RepID=A0AAQ3L4D7_9LILI|nr:hypothetical protein Cni_G27764 [Canna indica]